MQKEKNNYLCTRNRPARPGRSVFPSNRYELPANDTGFQSTKKVKTDVVIARFSLGLPIRLL